MNRWCAALLTLFLLGAVPAARANEAPPPVRTKPADPQLVKLVVEVDDDVKEPRLQIPRAFLGAAGERKGADLGPGRVPTIVAGLALTLAFASGGFWLLRRGSSRYFASAVLALSLVALSATALWADRLPIVPPKPASPKEVGTLALPAGIQVSDKIAIEVVDKGDAVKLIINKSMAIKKSAEVKPEAKPETKPDE
jgi:hypothetical protein